MRETHVMVMNTCPDVATARAVAAYLIEARLAACVSILPGVRSLYWWEGAVQDDAEHLLLIKTRADRVSQVEAAIRARHPYELPEVVAVPVTAGSAAYLRWIDDTLEQT